jgi:dTDP-4-dehydrorhamnose 3,5-epimerase
VTYARRLGSLDCATEDRAIVFIETKLSGAFIIDVDRHDDNRGFFGRVFCQEEFAAHELKPLVAQANVGSNLRGGTIRGMHFQYPPAAETKYVRCVRGAILDIIIDLRPESATYLQHVAVELSADNQRGLYIPERFGHGYQTLEDRTDTIYMVGEYYTPGMEGGLRHDDPELGLEWPLPIEVISAKDRGWTPLREIERDLRLRMTLLAPELERRAN